MLVFCLAAGVFACRGSDRSPVIATVNGRDIHRAQFERFLSLKMGEFTSGESPETLRSQMLDEYIRRRLVLDQAARSGITVSEAEIDQAARDDAQLRSTATTPEAREDVIDDLVIDKFYRQVVLRDVRVAPAEIQRYMDENQTRLTERAGFYVREIRVQSREAAERVHREVTEGRQEYASAARLQSDAPNAEQGGMARYDEGQLPAVLEKAIRLLRPGEVSPVIQSSFGFHIFKLERRVEAHSLDPRRSQVNERRAQLAEELIARKNQQLVDEALERLASSAAIRINDPALGFTYTGGLRHN
ncbi:MAG TPA: peptidyl-prolyl cis-trans isomerase [Blastocatellia bacterium]|jgi:parvulin-like peptidyl-prolyl isomerase|nr:peptidyl-prolyl cis-trans isomerase [Blastocatellia bacterium]